jgi:hypothetical protein
LLLRIACGVVPAWQEPHGEARLLLLLLLLLRLLLQCW